MYPVLFRFFTVIGNGQIYFAFYNVVLIFYFFGDQVPVQHHNPVIRILFTDIINKSSLITDHIGAYIYETYGQVIGEVLLIHALKPDRFKWDFEFLINAVSRM